MHATGCMHMILCPVGEAEKFSALGEAEKFSALSARRKNSNSLQCPVGEAEKFYLKLFFTGTQNCRGIAEQIIIFKR